MTHVCLAANTITYPEGGGHRWEYLHWALGLASLGCEVTWLEMWPEPDAGGSLRHCLACLRRDLEPYGLADRVAVVLPGEQPAHPAAGRTWLDLEEAAGADLLLNLAPFEVPAGVVGRFRRSALVDMDPGLTQVWLDLGDLEVARHDVYFTRGETVGTPAARFPDAGLPWRFTPPCVDLEAWRPRPPGPAAAFTTVAHWDTGDWVEIDGIGHPNSKRDGFLPYLALPGLTAVPLELAAYEIETDPDEVALLRGLGWRVRDTRGSLGSAAAFKAYVEASLGEFSCAKPSCALLANAWFSIRTLCYLAAGKPAVVEHTGESRLLPDAAGLFRFRSVDEAAAALATAAGDYEHQSRLARELAERFDARAVVSRLLEDALP